MANKEKVIKVEPQTREIFFNALENNNIEKVKNIMESEVSIVDTECINEALYEASFSGYLEIVKYLVEKGADINSKSDLCALSAASFNGHLEIVKYLIEKGASNIDEALWNASCNRDLELIKYLVDKGADVNAKVCLGETYLINAIRNQYLELVKYLVENGANDINDALMSASARGHLETVKYLIENGANINITNHLTDRTILMTAVRNGHLEVVQYLIECGADVNAKSRSGEIALIIASIRGYCEIVKCLAENGANDINDALIEASKSGKLGAVKCLVEHGADIDYKDNNGKTALMSALENEKLRIVAYFIEKCGDINAKYDYEYYISEGIEETEYDKEQIFGKYKGMTILMIASLLGKLETVKYLIKNGADVNIENYKCDTALDLTEKAYIDKEIRDEIIKALKGAGAI